MSAWSAGFVGIEAALSQPSAKDIDAVILIDGLHAPRANELAFKAQMKPFVDFARRAARRERSFLVSHSSIDPPDFASTTECAHYLIAALGGKPRPVRRSDRFGLETRGVFQRRGFSSPRLCWQRPRRPLRSAGRTARRIRRAGQTLEGQRTKPLKPGGLHRSRSRIGPTWTDRKWW